MNKAKSLSPAARIEAGTGRCLLFSQYLTYLAAAIAITVATGYYLWAVEVPVYDSSSADYNSYVCKAPTTDSLTDLVDQSNSFNVILKIYFALSVTEVVRLIILLIAVGAKSTKIARIYECFVFNDCLSFAALVILHVYRFQFSGKYCSLDNDSSVEKYWLA